MNKNNNDYIVKYSDAKYTMDIHLYGLQGHGYQTLQLHNRVIRSLLSSLISGSNEKKFIYCDENSLLGWMITDVKNRKINCAASHLRVVDRYIEQLCTLGLLPDNPLRKIKPRHLRPTWNCVVKALQSSKPLEQLEKLRPPDPQPGPLYAHIKKYIRLQQSLGKKYEKHYRVLCRLDALLLTHRIDKSTELKTKHIHEWLGQMQCSKAGQVKHVSVLKHFIDYLIGIGAIQSNPAIAVIREYGKVHSKKFHPLILTKEQITSILKKAGSVTFVL